jgi:predicted RecA/RadA family phage recombinase
MVKMKSFIQPGNVVTLVAPTGGVKSGDLVQIGMFIGIAAIDAAEGDDFECALTGVYELPKTAGSGIDQGAIVLWDASASACVGAPGAGNTPIGAATEAAGSSATKVRVRLDGIARAAVAEA